MRADVWFIFLNYNRMNIVAIVLHSPGWPPWGNRLLKNELTFLWRKFLQDAKSWATNNTMFHQQKEVIFFGALSRLTGRSRSRVEEKPLSTKVLQTWTGTPLAKPVLTWHQTLYCWHLMFNPLRSITSKIRAMTGNRKCQVVTPLEGNHMAPSWRKSWTWIANKMSWFKPTD